MTTSRPAAALSPLHSLPPAVLALQPRALWAAFRLQPLSAQLVAAYLFFEYVRPQSIYRGLDFFPWAQTCLLGALALTLLHDLKVRKLMMLDGAMLVFTIVVISSSVLARYPDVSFKYLDIFLSWVIVYWVISAAVNTQTKVVLMFIGWLLWNFKMSQHAFRSWASIGFGFRDWGVTGAPGWFHNSGEFGVEMTMMFPISLYFALALRKHVSRWGFAALLFLPVTAVSGAIASSSRGALVGIAAVLIWVLARSRFKMRAALLLLVAVPILYAVVPDEQKARFSSAGDDATSVSRLTYWERGFEFATDHPVLGVGYRNWMPYYLDAIRGRLDVEERVSLPHNIFIEALAELGYTGLCALLALIAGTFVLNSRTRRLGRQLGDSGAVLSQLSLGLDGALVGFLSSGFFVTVLYYPFIWVNLGMTAAVYLSMRRAYASRGSVASAQVAGYSAQPRGHEPAWTTGR